MKFYWPAPLDLIDPTFDFRSEKGIYGSAKQKNQCFPHEIFDKPVYHGFVVSKAYFEKGGGSRWSISQLNRFYREGAKRFLRIPDNSGLQVMGDSGAYTKSFNEQSNSHLIDECMEVINFYNSIGVDYGFSPDNVIPGSWIKDRSIKRRKLPPDWEKRWERTLHLAETFKNIHSKKALDWKPIGVAQGWDPNSYRQSVEALQYMGYNFVALGGLNRLESEEINSCIEACGEVRLKSTTFHLLGVSRIEYLAHYESLGVTSFDSSMPIRQAINDDKHNYHWYDKNYIAIRVPQTYASPRIKQLLNSEGIDAKSLIAIEQETLAVLRSYDSGENTLEDTLRVVRQGIEYRREQDFLEAYLTLLTEKAWKKCLCPICKELGIEVTLLRNRERNLRRGFHNLYIFSERLKAIFPKSWL